MSSITEIEAAIERLPAPQIRELAEWLNEFRRRNEAVVEHTDLDALVGTWLEDEGFDLAIRAFEQVDEASWK